MSILKKKISPRRKQLRDSIAAEKFAKLSEFVNSGVPVSILILAAFAGVCIFILSIITAQDTIGFKSPAEIIALGIITVGITMAAAVYVAHYYRRIVKRHLRAVAMAGLFTSAVLLTKLGSFFPNREYLAVACAIGCAIILVIAYDQRLAMCIGVLMSPLICFAAKDNADFALFITMAAGIITSCFLLKEIRTRIKLLQVGVFASIAVFVIYYAAGLLENQMPQMKLLAASGKMAASAVFVGVFIQALLPLIEKVFRIATSMTLLDYSDANQPLLKKLAMEAPGTFSHSLLIGSIAEAAAEAVGANGLLCRVGAYYHDIGKIGKPRYFIENQLGSSSRHDSLSPAMSQLIIAGHVKDGIEMAKEYRLPAVIRQFIETHHGTTLIEYFYQEAKKRADGKTNPPSEAEFRYPGPKPQTKEAAILMLADAVESAVRSLSEITPTKIETVVHNMALKRLQDGQFDECELTLRELSKIEVALSKTLAAHHHGRIAYPKPIDKPEQENGNEN